MSGDGDFAESVRRWREALEWSQARLAEELERRGSPLTALQIHRIERRNRGVSIGEAAAISLALGVDLADMVSPPRTDDPETRAAEEAATQSVRSLRRVLDDPRYDDEELLQAAQAVIDRHRELRAFPGHG